MRGLVSFSAMEDPGTAVHYTAVAKGTPIYASDGEPVGEVVKVLDNYREHILDGIVFTDPNGEKRFVDGPEVQRTFEKRVELNIPASQAHELGPPPHRGGGGLLGRLRPR